MGPDSLHYSSMVLSKGPGLRAEKLVDCRFPLRPLLFTRYHCCCFGNAETVSTVTIAHPAQRCWRILRHLQHFPSPVITFSAVPPCQFIVILIVAVRSAHDAAGGQRLHARGAHLRRRRCHTPGDVPARIPAHAWPAALPQAPHIAAYGAEHLTGACCTYSAISCCAC